MGLPIYTANTLIAMSDGWFRHPTQSQPGNSITLLRQYVKADMTVEQTYFVTRIRHRKEGQRMSRQSETGYPYYRRDYTATHQTYTVCAMSWSDHAITVLSEHSSKSDAITALQHIL